MEKYLFEYLKIAYNYSIKTPNKEIISLAI